MRKSRTIIFIAASKKALGVSCAEAAYAIVGIPMGGCSDLRRTYCDMLQNNCIKKNFFANRAFKKVASPGCWS
jgi:hypothetical protein